MLNMQNVKDIEIPEGDVRTIHDKDSRLIWGRLAYDTKYAGDTYQQTYRGKNLCALGTKTVEAYELFPLVKPLPAGTYTFSAQVTSTDTQSLVCFIRFMNGSSGVGPARISRSDERTHITVTTSDTADSIYLYAGYDSSGSTGDTATFTDIQIESGSTPTSYEPYTGGIPAPSPSYPMPISAVTGEQTVTVSDGVDTQSYPISLTGKNLLDSLDGYTDGYISSDGTIGSGGGVNALFDYMSVDSSSTYTLSASETTRMSFAYFDESKTFISRDANIDDDEYTITTPANCKYVRVWVYRTSSAGGITQSYLESLELQFEKGSQASSYVPYYNYELCKIGDYQDYIYKSGDDWYVHKAVGKVNLSNITNWTVQQTTLKRPTNQSQDIPNIRYPSSNSEVGAGIAEKYIMRQATGISGSPVGYMALTANYYFLVNVGASGPDPTGLFYYALATPTDTQITDATLISQLDAVHEWLTRYGYSSTVTGNLPIIINQTNL